MWKRFSTEVSWCFCRHKGSSVKKYKSNDLKVNIQKFLEYEEYKLGAVQAYMRQEKNQGSLPFMSESFGSFNSHWGFDWLTGDCIKSYVDTIGTNVVGNEIIVPAIINRILATTKHCREMVISCTSGSIFEKGYQALLDYVNGKELEPKAAIAMQVLERFFHEKDEHQIRLAAMFLTRSQMTETKVSAILAKHLLSQLLPYPSNYFLDNRSKGKQEDCPCGCGVPIHFGHTYVGSPYLFYGFADIVLFPTNKDLFMDADNSSSAVFTLKKKANEDYGHRTVEKACNDEDDILTGECKLHDHDLSSEQICKQAISTSICKYAKMREHASKHLSMSELPMVPVCAITKNSFEIAMYDTENDFLLKSSEDLDLFEPFDDLFRLRFSAIIYLWLYINHSIFLSKPHPSTVEVLRGTCNLIPQLGKRRFESVVNNSNMLLSPEYFPNRSLRRVEDADSLIVDKKGKKFPISKLTIGEEEEE